MKVPISESAPIGLDAPVLPAYEKIIDGMTNWVVWCWYCGQWHRHGPTEGHGEAHCLDSGSPKRGHSRKRILIVALAIFAVLVVAFTVYVVRGNIFDPLDRGRSVVSDEFVGQTKAAIEARYGEPSNEWAGHYGNPPDEYTKEHTPAISTAYRRGGGTLYLSFEQRQGEWVCFSSHWMPNGCVF